MSDLTEFLLARIAEDEAAAEKARPHEYLTTRDDPTLSAADVGVYKTVAITSGRVLAECEVKRAIIGEHDPIDPCDAHDASMETITCDTLRYLALVYEGHPDYREEWRP